MRPDHVKGKTTLGRYVQFKRRLGKHHKILGCINIQINSQGRVKTGRTGCPFGANKITKGCMRGADRIWIKEQRNLLLRIVGKAHDCCARTQ